MPFGKVRLEFVVVWQPGMLIQAWLRRDLEHGTLTCLETTECQAREVPGNRSLVALRMT